MNDRRTAQNAAEFIGHGVPWLAAPSFPYPRPFTVLNQATLGTPEAVAPAVRSSTVRPTGSHDIPSGVPSTRHPYGLNQSTGVPATTLDAGRGSMPKSFQSSMSTRLSRPSPQEIGRT